MNTMHRFSLLLLCLTAPWVAAEFPASQLERVFPPGGRPGTSFSVKVDGAGLENPTRLYSPHPGISFQGDAQGSFQATIAADVLPGRYTVQVLNQNGLSSSRLLMVNDLPVVNEEDLLEAEPQLTDVTIPVALQGVIGAKGDIDIYRFAAQAGQLLILECWANRLDSALRGVLEVQDAQGKRLAVNRGYFGTDAFLAVEIPRTGKYQVRISDLVFGGGTTAFYRLEIHDRPRVLFTIPAAINADQTGSLIAYGYNLNDNPQKTLLQSHPFQIDSMQRPLASHALPVVADSTAVGISSYPLLFPNAHVAVAVAVTDLVVVNELEDPETEQRNNSSAGAVELPIPVDVTGRLTEAADRDWYRVRLRKGEVIYVQTYGQRIGSPVDLSVYVFDEAGENRLATFDDQLVNIGQRRFPSSHLDAAGRFVAPREGIFHLVVRDRTSGSQMDPRRIYRMVIRRASPGLQVIVMNRYPDKPAGVTLRPGGNVMLHLLAFPSGGLNTSVKVSAVKLPPGVQCTPSWIGPAVRQTPLVLHVQKNAQPYLGRLELQASYQQGGETITQPVLAGAMSRSGTPNGSGRLESQLTVAIADQSPLVATARIDRERYQQGSIIDLHVTLDRLPGQPAEQMLLSGEGLPPGIQDRVQRVTSADSEGVVSFYIPPYLPVGKYSIAARVRTKMSYPVKLRQEDSKPQDVELVTNVVSFEVYPAPYVVKVDLDAPVTIRRGEIVQLKYSARRQNGFIGKIHTELAAPGGVQGIRGRGVTFVGQTDSGVIQIIANDDAPLGQQSGLRLEGLGTVEDQGVHLGSVFLNLEVIE